ncbi:trehalose-phosphatase, partial [Candidatus Daviesbacteria bacterium]|nr:trehalose-phosphatase [Candidatus Daviesbacteria bacterium]
MDLWKDLDKITAFFKKSPVKIIMLDFDGTLTPIVNSPKEARLSIGTRYLLQKLCQKPNLYLAIISGRELKDIKKRIGVPNIIYGGNHGLEGEIFGKEYSFPITKQIMTALRNIRKQLVKIANQFQGAQVENKDRALSFHYRSVATEQLQEVISLFKT